MTTDKVLTGIRVLDFSRYLAGPYCGMLLADMGADVIRVEKPGGEEDRNIGPFVPPTGEGLFTMITPRNKRGISLNIKTDKGIELLRELVIRSDVVLHNFTSGSEEFKILKYESLKDINPAIILVIVSGFDPHGPYAGEPAFDFIAQALTGSMSYTGFPGNPPTKAGMAWVDYGTGTHAAVGTLSALYYRQATGEGQEVNVSLLDVATTLMASIAAEHTVLGRKRQQVGNASYYIFSDSFQAKDGMVMLSPISNPLWKRFAKAIGREDLKNDPRFKDDMARFENRDDLIPIVSQWISERTVGEVTKEMGIARIPCARINNVEEMLSDPKVKSTNMLPQIDYPEVGKVTVPGVPVKLSKTPGSIERRAPKVGEHNQELYCDLLGYKTSDLSQWQAEGII